MANRTSRLCAVVAATFAVIVVSPATADADEIVGFSSPSGNIGCMMDSSFVRCDIIDRAWTPPPRPADCAPFVDFGQGIMLNEGQPARFVCAGDTALGADALLAYGDKITRGSLECESTQAGMSCWDFVYGGSFVIARDYYELN